MGYISNPIFLLSTGNSNLKKNLFLIAIFSLSCDPFVTQFEDVEDAVHYTASSITGAENSPAELKIMTWNIRFGAGRMPWFGDSCGENVIIQSSVVVDTLSKIANFINDQNPDVLLLQEVDVSSKRTGYIDQVQWLLDNTDFNYGVYASMWQADFIPSDGLGKVDAGNAILSKWPIKNAERIQLPLRGDQDDLEQYFYLRRNILKSSVLINDGLEIEALCTHTTAFATDDTKKKHLEKFHETLSNIGDDKIFVAGGDLNALTSSYEGDERNFCDVDRCAEDVCDDDYINNEIYQGSYFNHLEGEEDFLTPLYEDFNAAVPLIDTNSSEHFTHSTWITSEDFSDDDGPYNRKLDYIFSSHLLENTVTHDKFNLSDHAPITTILDVDND